MLWWDDNAATNKGSQPSPVFMESEDNDVVPCYRSMGTIQIPRKISLGGRKSDLPNVNLFNDNITQNGVKPNLRKISAPNLVTSSNAKAYKPLPRRKISCPVAVTIKSSQNKTLNSPIKRKVSCPMEVAPEEALEKHEISKEHISEFEREKPSQLIIEATNQIYIKTSKKTNIDQNNNDSAVPGSVKKRESKPFETEIKKIIEPIKECSKEDDLHKIIEMKEMDQTKPKTEKNSQLVDLKTNNPKFEGELSLKTEGMSHLMEELLDNNIPTPKLNRKNTKGLSDKIHITFEEKETNVSLLQDEVYETTEDLYIKTNLQKAKCCNTTKSEATNRAVIFKQKVSHAEVKIQKPLIKEELKRGSMKDKWGLKLVYQMSQEGGLCLGILKVTSFTAGHKAKLQPGDHVLTINDWQIQSMEEPQVAANLFRAAGFSVVLGLERSNLTLDQWILLDDF